jgi:hypothetical protein
MMLGRSRIGATAGALVTMLALLACKKKLPTEIVASCDFRGTEGGSTCMDIHDKGLVPRVEGICRGADSTGSHWHAGAACDQTGALGGCASQTATSWHYGNDKEKTADDVKKACRSDETFVTPKAPGAGAASAGGGPAVAIAPSPLADVSGLLGTKADGWPPKPFASLKYEMKPAEVAKVVPGADKVDYGVAEITSTGVKGVAKYKFRYVDKKLVEVEIHFDKAAHTPQFKDQIIAAANAKWGNTSSEKGPGLMFWHGTGLQMASLGEEDGADRLTVHF